MKREILFKAKRVDNGKWIEGFLTKKGTYGGVFCIARSHGEGGFMEWGSTVVIPETVCQFTGLTDKNGNKIFEGDILQDGITVIYRQDLASFALTKEGWAYDHYFGEAIDPGQCEIIGNIHE